MKFRSFKSYYTSNNVSVRKQFIHTLQYFNCFNYRLLVLFILGILSSILAVMVPLVFASIVDSTADLLRKNATLQYILSWNGIIKYILAFAVSMFISDIFRILYGKQTISLTNKIIIKAKTALCNSIIPINENNVNERSQVAYIITSDCQNLSDLYSTPLTTVISDLIDTFCMCIVIYFISWEALLFLLLPMFPIFFIAKKAGEKQRQLATSIRNEETNLSRHADDAVTNWVTVRLFNGIKKENRKTTNYITAINHYMSQANFNLAKLMLNVSILRILAISTALCFITFLTALGKIQLGFIATLMLYLSKFYSPAVNLSKAYQNVQKGAVSASNIIQYLNRTEKEEKYYNINYIPRKYIKKQIKQAKELSWKNLKITMPNKRILTLPDVNVKKNGLILIEGKSGSGKSTFLRSLLGIGYLPSSGSFMWNGENLNDLNIIDRFNIFSYAGQENSIFNGSIMESITYPHAIDGNIGVRARANLYRVSLSYLENRVMSSANQTLSFGEGRRIVLARALTRIAPVLITDEVTSNLDPSSKMIIENILLEESLKRIVLVAAHGASKLLVENAYLIIRFS